MSAEVVIIGAGGHGRVVADIVRACGDRLCGFLDDNTEIGEYCGASVLGTPDEALKMNRCRFVIAVGDATDRKRIADFIDANGLMLYTAVHPLACVSPSAVIGEGSVIMPLSVVNARAVVGRHVIVNTGAVAEHDCVLGDFSHLSTHAALGGTVHIGAFTHVGLGASVKNNITVCEHCVIGAGAAVVRDITSPGVWAGVPARPLNGLKDRSDLPQKD